jgi:hypothetical protein
MIQYLIYTEHHNILYVVGSFLLYFFYLCCDKILLYTNNNYRELDNDKKMYAVSNISKSIVLCVLTYPAYNILYDTMFENRWNNTIIRNVGIIYAIPDTISLMVVNKMDITTKIHHVVVCIFNIASLQNDYGEENVIRCMIIYASFSSFAFIVNFMLGSRYLHNSALINKQLSRISFIIYGGCCLINWIWHVFYMPQIYNRCGTNACKNGTILYGSMILAIAYDDIVLNKWLYKKSDFSIFKTHQLEYRTDL